MALRSRPFSHFFQLLDSEWTDWQEKFAWYPRRLKIGVYHTQPYGNVATITTYENLGYRWIWMKKYWHRQRYERMATSSVGGRVIEDDYAFDLFEIVQKS